MSAKKYRPQDTVDFVVVGSGAAGGVMARELSVAGFDVVVMEQGPRLAPADFEHDELKYSYLNGILNTPELSPQTYRKLPTEKALRVRDMNALWYARIVGGSSNHFTANFWRLRPVDFRERSLLGEIPGTGFADWPIDYDELEPYYTKVEWDIGVSGLAGACPTDPPRSMPYPMPPLPVKSSGVLFERGARKLGLHPYPAPMAIASVPYRGRPACQHCGFCMGYGCEWRAKSSTLSTVIPEAEATGRCEVRAASYVFRIDTDARGRATGVAYFDDGRHEHFQKARVVVVCANGGETPRLLLNSANAKFPDGLANSSGLVGKYLMFNQGGIAGGVFEHELNEHKSVQVTRVLHDFYDSDPKRGFYGGGGIDARINPVPIGMAHWGLPAEWAWGAPLKRALRDMPRTMYSTGHCTSLPLERNSVSIDPELKDAWGVPAIRVTYKEHPDDLACSAWLTDRAHEILVAAGAERTWKLPAIEFANSPHLLGTCRMGDDPAKSVVDRYHRSHDIPNLFVCDGSSMVTSGRGQPTMTIQALAFRAGDHIARFAKRGGI
jgi:choline dehydrogenase-like flavoprotein